MKQNGSKFTGYAMFLPRAYNLGLHGSDAFLAVANPYVWSIMRVVSHRCGRLYDRASQPSPKIPPPPPTPSLAPTFTTLHDPLTAMSAQTYQLFCMGNPLLDMQVTNGEELLKKYDLKSNDAILAEEKHAPIYRELVENHKITYVAGGAAQNAARGAAYVLPPHSVVYTGCVGDDDLAEQLKAANKREGLDQVYLVKKGE
ncbi:hypothetical protein NUW54_g14771 [Trametes sanguinea]|uniref:Uncharacterized protein n=1 Tax=Trametes sanguinea TaxID=158606 RepID=A0ACC1MAK4_9APHY|nr:hypothetical protein NUW54_g14771 [Trametes sanguinea]